MKKFSKNSAIILSVILSVVLIIGLLFSFVPMTFGDKTWVGLSNSINISSDVLGGFYGEYEIKTENPTREDIEQSKSIIRKVLADKGYKNVKVSDISGKKIRVEVSYPRGGQTYQDVTSTLNTLTTGKFMLQSASSVTETTKTLDGTKHVKEIKIEVSSSAALKIIFNEEGVAAYKALCDSLSNSTTIYLALGTQTQQIDIQNAIAQEHYSSLELYSTYDALFSLKQNIEIGCMAVQLKENLVSINTMSPSFTAGESASSPDQASFFSSSTYVILIASIAFVVVMLLTLFGIKFGYYAILMFVTMLINAVLFLVIMNLIPSIEFGFSAFIAMLIVTAVIYTYAFDFAMTVKKQYNEGKSLSAALENAYKGKFVSLIISNTIMFLSSLAFILLSFGELTSFAIIFAAGIFLSMLTNMFIIPLLIKICISFGNFGTTLFMLKKRSLAEALKSNEIQTNEKEAE